VLGVDQVHGSGHRLGCAEELNLHGKAWYAGWVWRARRTVR
jgi:hypothetical protein